MGIKSKKKRPSLLGSIEVSSLQPEEKEVVQSQQQTESAVSQNTMEVQTEQPAYVPQQPAYVAPQPVYNQQPGQQQFVQNPVAYQTSVPTTQNSQPLVQIPHSHIMQQEMYIKPVKPMGIPGRKRRQLVPGEPEKMVSMELPVSLIAKVQEYGRQNGLTMKEVIGYILLEKFK